MPFSASLFDDAESFAREELKKIFPESNDIEDAVIQAKNSLMITMDGNPPFHEDYPLSIGQQSLYAKIYMLEYLGIRESINVLRSNMWIFKTVLDELVKLPVSHPCHVEYDAAVLIPLLQSGQGRDIAELLLDAIRMFIECPLMKKSMLRRLQFRIKKRMKEQFDVAVAGHALSESEDMSKVHEEIASLLTMDTETFQQHTMAPEDRVQPADIDSFRMI